MGEPRRLLSGAVERFGGSVRTALAALFGIVLCSACAACSKRADDTKSAGAAPVKPTGVSVTRSVSLPVQVITDPSKTSADPATLTISEADDDETAEGPSTFDVRPDKGFVVADPLRQRVVFYDAAGKYQQELLLSMAPQHVRVLPDNALSIVRYQTGQRYIYEMDAAGQYKAPRLATPSDPDLDAEDGGESNLNGPQSGIVRPLPLRGPKLLPWRSASIGPAKTWCSCAAWERTAAITPMF